MTPEDLQKLWREQQEKLNRAEILNQKVIGTLTREKAKSLAPFPILLMAFFAVIFAFGIFYCIKFDPMYYPVPLLCIAGAVMQWFKIRMRNNLSDMGNSVIERELKVLRCKRNFRKMWVVTWILFIPYIIWFDWWMKGMLDSKYRLAILIVTIVGSGIAFAVHAVRVTRALREIDRYTNYLKEFREL